MHKLSIRHIGAGRISSRDDKKLIEQMRKCVKSDPVVKKKFKEYNVPIDKIDDVCIEFTDLDVSAKTKDKKIYINKDLIGKIDDLTHYVAHEMVHFLQQYTGNIEGHQEVKDYLDKPTEIEAYQTQIDFKERHESPEEAERYLDELLDYHDITDSKERKEKKEKLKD